MSNTPASADLRHTFAAYPTGIALVAAEVDGRVEAMLATSLTTISLDPPLISLAFDHRSSTWPRLRLADELGITVLSATQLHLMSQLRLPGPARLAGITFRPVASAARMLDGAAATMRASVHDLVPAGDHELALLRVLDHHRYSSATPLVFVDRAVTTPAPRRDDVRRAGSPARSDQGAPGR